MMPEPCILGIDQGTTNSKAILVNLKGEQIAHGSCAVQIAFPRPGWVEQDAVALWQSVQTAIDRCLAAASQSVDIRAVGISSQRESGVLWDRQTGAPLGPLVSWQCRRGSVVVDHVRGQGHEEAIVQRSGLPLDPMFTASKLRWLIDHTPDGPARAANGELCAGTVDSWLIWNLSGGTLHRCDASNAARTQLFNIHDLAWDPDLVAWFGVPAAALPEVMPSSAIFCETSGSGALPAGIPVASAVGDSHAALFGHAGFTPGAVKATYGTGSSLMSPVLAAAIPPRGLAVTVAWKLDRPMYAFEGNITVTGAAIQWLADVLGLESPTALAALAAETTSSDGVYLVPAFAGLGAPHWDNEARGIISGLTRGTNAKHLARAVIESVAYQIRDVFDVMDQAVDAGLDVLLADGGMTRNESLMQFQADILGRPVIRNNTAELSATGASYLAGLAVGVWKSLEEIANLPRSVNRFDPAMPAADREALYAGWREAVERARSRPE